jgi:2-haloalkanoic acid dehalogenase type II
MLNALQPLLDANKASFTREHLLRVYQEVESAQQAKTPDMKYAQILSTIHPHIATRLGLNEPSSEQNETFGSSVGKWPAFPDTVDALKRLGKHYKLVILSNVDRESFSETNAGPLQGFPFDAIFTAQDIGSYKPDLRNFEYMLREVESKFGIEKAQVLQTAQSQFHDHHPANKVGIKTSWIARTGAVMGNLESTIYNWKFDTLGEMADELEKELKFFSVAE